jgi:hypothetical protein
VGTHHKKRRFTVCDKGGTPIEKNIIVVDESGNRYEATYPKRAKGLVKNGRARFISENMICLACPPNINDLEEHLMTDKNVTESAPIADAAPEAASAEKAAGTAEFSIPYILAQLSALQNDTAYIHNALDSLLGITSGKRPVDDIAGPNPVASAADAVGQIIAARENTNQQLIKVYHQLLFQLIGMLEDNDEGSARPGPD